MKVIDIRKFTGEDFKLLKVNSEEIIGCKGIETDTSAHIDFLRYDIKNKAISNINTDTLITKFYWSSPMFLNDKYIYVGVFKNNEENGDIVIHSINMKNGRISEKLKIEMGDKYFNNIIFLDEEYFILYINDYPSKESDYNMHKDLEGDYDIAFLYNIKTGEKHIIKDKRIILGVRDHLLLFNKEKEKYILFEEAYMEDWEMENSYGDYIPKEDSYYNQLIESINVISLKDFVKNIIEGTEIIPFEEIHKTELDGWTRYFGMSEEDIYYRVKDFKTGLVDIWSLNKNTLEKNLIHTLDLKYIETFNKDCKIKYDNSTQLIYMIKRNVDRIWIKELLNNEVDIVYDKDLGEFEGFTDERYLITSSWNEDEEEEFFEIVTIKDISKDELKEYKCSVHCYEDMVVLY